MLALRRRLLSWRSSLHLDVDERWQLLRYIRRKNGWLAAGKEILWPVRVSVWLVKERLVGRGTMFGALPTSPSARDLPPISNDIPSITCIVLESPSEAWRQHLRAEADRHVGGSVRLAGGSRHVLDIRPDIEGRFADFEDHNCFHRLYWAPRLAGAHRCGHATAGEIMVRDLLAWLNIDWSADHRYGFAYTTSERIINVTEALQVLRADPIEGSDELVGRLKRLIWSDARHLEDHVEHALGAHNHVVTNARALMHAARLLPDCPESARWSAHAYELWDAMWPDMVMADGSFREGSSFYLLMNVRSVLDFLQFSEEDARPVSEEIRTRLRRAVELADDLMRADGSLPRFGNISPDHVIGDLRDVLLVARRRGVIDATRTSGPRATPRQPAVYADGGWGFLADPEKELEVVVHADPRPDPQTHADAGKGSFEVWYRGASLIRDPGNSTYALPARRYFRSAAAQNVSTLDGIGIGITEEYARMLPEEYVGETSAALEAEGPSIVLTAGGWSRAWEDVRLRRTLRFLPDGQLLLEEEIAGPSQRRHFASYLHLGDTTCEKVSPREWLLGDAGARVRVSFELPDGIDVRIQKTEYAAEYGVTLAGQALVLQGSVPLPFSWSMHCEALLD